ncbi:MAG TPA: helix-turn-helix domain-containing protein [Novosphingobium sp.]|nr:helix-turn-helix domain-containing protein [Novosphingobium sp.]
MAEKAKPPVRKRSANVDTRIKIMEAAERLFGEQGVDAVALRSISIEARQKNTASVQYHFTDKLGLLQAIFEYREGQLDIMRGELLRLGREHWQLSDIRWLLRVCFLPNFRHFTDNAGLPYIKLHAQYLANLRPRGIPHPVDYECPSTTHFRDAIARMARKLNFLTIDQFNLRLESVGAMFLGAVIQLGSRPEPPDTNHAAFFETILDMMAAAMAVPPWAFEPPEDTG